MNLTIAGPLDYRAGHGFHFRVWLEEDFDTTIDTPPMDEWAVANPGAVDRWRRGLWQFTLLNVEFVHTLTGFVVADTTIGGIDYGQVTREGFRDLPDIWREMREQLMQALTEDLPDATRKLREIADAVAVFLSPPALDATDATE